ncbi:RNA processing factor 1 [Sphaerosporella brunnea]|uniref:RNA processing factor 1 n=1 Tax=Sphaerosporella brunnea TaxID=1250544 RepID=A0A5J5FBL8_9PEZI|nr:RNA processing factor 1 [Sphaerosporella brunnea]
MAKVKKTSTSQKTSRTFRIPNKLHRQAHSIRLKTALGAAKRKEKFDRKKAEAKDPSLREKRMVTNIPDTIERKRIWDERIPGAVPTAAGEEKEKNDEAATAAAGADEAAQEELAAKELAAAHETAQEAAAESAEIEGLFPTLSRPPEGPPRILLTTSRFNHTHDQATELANLFPNTTYVPRNNDLGILDMCKIASKPTKIDPSTGEVRKPYSHLIVANVNAKLIDALTIIVLPAGPTFRFTMSSYQPAMRIGGHGRPTSHIPELILNNFLTPLGKTTAGLFQSLFPQQPELQGRQVVTLHNQRDFIFFRRHRYVFREKRETEKEAGFGLDTSRADGGKGMEGLGVRVGLQEIGPRFTLKLRRVERGIKKDTVFEWNGGMDKVRTKFQL